MPSRATIVDIARRADVSTATVDRVLNNREGVKAPTRERVLRVASTLGYRAAPWNLAAGPRPPAGGAGSRRAGAPRFRAAGGQQLVHERARAASSSAAARSTRAREVHVHIVDSLDPGELSRAIGRVAGESAGVGVIALDHPSVREALRDLSRANVPFVTIASDIGNVGRVAYVGIDNRAAGRLAGHLIGRFLPREPVQAALFAGSLAYRGHEEREMGFRHVLAERFPQLRVVELREVQDDDDRSYEEAGKLLAKYPRLGAIYNIGAGVRGIARALEEHGRAQDVVFVAHDLTEHTRRYLLSGSIDAVLDQSPRVEARDAVERLVQAARGLAQPNLPAIGIQVIFSENIPDA